jgi:hypothetical protein
MSCSFVRSVPLQQIALDAHGIIWMSGHLRFWAVCNRPVTLCAMCRNNTVNSMYDISFVLKWLDRFWAYGRKVVLMCHTVFYWIECSTEVPGRATVPECPS